MTDHDLDPKRVQELVEQGEAQLVDVRMPAELGNGRIGGSIHIELEQLGGESDQIERDRPVVFYCRVGRRSALATEAFRAAGYDAYNMTGGINGWAEAGLPVEPESGER